MTHDKERARSIPLFDEVDRLIGDDVGRISLLRMFSFLIDEHRIEIMSLSRNDHPMIESSRFVSLPLAQMPFADQRRLITTMRA